jgi:Leucyl-tRNA synthetase
MKDNKYYIEAWQKSKNFRVENDRIKPKSYLFSSFPKTNLYGFQDGNIRTLLFGDFYSRYLRMAGYNVLFPTGFDSLGLSSYMENKKRSNVINDDISLLFEEQMYQLGIGIDPQKKMDLKHEEFISSLQLSFIELFERSYIKYDKIKVYQDKTGKKILDSHFAKKNLSLNLIKAFYLDISSIQENLISNIEALPLSLEMKQDLKNMLEPKQSITIPLSVSNGAKLEITFTEPEYMGGISFIAIHPDYIDFSMYTQYEEFAAIEAYLSDENTNDFGVSTGNYAINPLTGKKIPLFVSVKYDCPIYVANPYLIPEDRITATEEGLSVIDVVQNGVFIESDFLNGIPEAEGKELLLNQFGQAEIGVLNAYNSKDKILLSSLDTFGALIPFFADSEQNLYSLKHHLPFLLSAKFRPIISDDIDVPGNMISGSMNHLCSTGMLPILAMLYDSIGASSSIFSKEAVRTFSEWKGIDLLTIPATEVYEYIFMPLCIWTIIEKEKMVKLPPLFTCLQPAGQVKDDMSRVLSRSNNNLIDLSTLICQYSADALRLYFLSKPLDQDFLYAEVELARLENLRKTIEAFFAKPFLLQSQIKDEFDQMVQACLKHLAHKEVHLYIEEVLSFFKSKLWNTGLTHKQGLIFLKLLYPVCPFLAEEVYQTIFKGKYLISDDGWIA